MTSGGNLKPAQADLGGWMGRMNRRCFIPTASSTNGLGTNPTASRRIVLNATVPFLVRYVQEESRIANTLLNYPLLRRNEPTKGGDNARI
jgi:hypothetical protein